LDRQTTRLNSSLSRYRKERELLYEDITPSRQLNGRRCLADQSLVRKVFASERHALDIEVPFEVVLDFGRGPRFADLAQMIDNGAEKYRCALRHVLIDRLESRLYVLLCLLGIEQIGIHLLEKRRI
jgi:hypothetical protein